MNATAGRSPCVRWAFLLAGLVCCSTLAFGDGSTPSSPSGPWVWSGDPAGLHALSFNELDDLYRRATVHDVPTGWMLGRIIAFTNVPAPKTVKRLADRFWIGKHVDPNGNFINQWKYRSGVTSKVAVGPSFTDGKPSILFEYPRLTPVFGPTRDECREIAPGLLLVKMYRRVPPVTFLGYSTLRSINSACGMCTSPELAQNDREPRETHAGGWFGLLKGHELLQNVIADGNPQPVRR